MKKLTRKSLNELAKTMPIIEEMSKFRHSGNSEALYEPSNKDFYHIK